MNQDTAVTLLEEILEALAIRVESEREYLTELDSQIGDGDFGANLHRGLQASLDAVDELEDPTPADFVETIGETLLDEMAGSSGIIFGMSLIEASEAIRDGVDQETIAAFANEFRAAVEDRGEVSVGAKTMYDVVVPVSDVLQASVEMEESDPLMTSANAVEAARRGAMFTSGLRAKRGRASYTEWRSVGHPDPGAVGSYIILKEIHRSLEQHYGKTLEPTLDTFR